MAATIAAGSGSGRKPRDQGAARDEFPVLEEKVGEMEVAAALICLNPADGPGLALARRLHAETAWKQRPVILLTNQAERLAARAVNSEGVSACLFRPMRMRQLAATLERLLAPAGEESAAAPVASSGVSGKQLHVLLVEDNPVNQRVGSLMLQKSACAVTLAPNGRHALEELEIRSYDLVLLDCQMPELDGFETTRRIRANEAAGRWPGRRRQLVVAMTANAMEGDRERCLQAGMDNYLPKPMRPEQLRAILQQAERDRDAESAGARSA
jgi:CheY-like chemotaxis protein